ncbi:MAG: hypothetical protein IH608_12320 [Proteobacteria bacterium]|nr:hypothetical protein [Pseudomonadota bacterium]
MNRQPHDWHLPGLDGAHPLAFLAALGTLRVATIAWPHSVPTLRWIAAEGAWRPVLAVEGVSDREALLSGLCDQLSKMAEHPTFRVGDNINFTSEQFRALAEEAQRLVPTDGTMAAFLGAFACEAVVDNQSKQVVDTAFRTMRGAGHQHFVKTMRDLAQSTDRGHLEDSLFHPWRYGDIGMGLRWDPQDDRRYALRWSEPSRDPTRTERGANRLAVEALPLFPVQPVRRRLATTGFSRRSRRTLLSWPVWEPAASVDVVRSLLALVALQEERPPRDELEKRGVVEVFRSERITLGKYRNFTPALPV